MHMWRKYIIGFLVAVLTVPMLAVSSVSALTVSPVVIEYEADAGDTIVGTIKLRNEGAESETFYPFAQDFVAGDEAGTPAFVEKANRSMSEWVRFDRDPVVIDGGQDELVIYRIKVPEDASPGGYFGGLLFSTSKQDDEGNGVGTVGVTGPIVLIRISGNVVEQGAVTDFTATPSSSTSLPIEFTTRFQNSGTVHLKPAGFVRIKNMFGGTSAIVPMNEGVGNVLPSSARQFSTTWQKTELAENASELAQEWKNFGFGPYSATLIMNYGEQNSVVSATTSFWVMPWMLVVLFVILAVIAVLLIMQYNKWIIAKAGTGKKKKK